MKALEFSRYGDTQSFKIVEVDRPMAKQGEVLIRVMASSVNRADIMMFTGIPYLTRLDGMAFFTPKHTRLGSDVAGIIEAVGEGVVTFKVGDEVVGDLADCGFGALAEYAIAPVEHLALKPNAIPFEVAVAAPMAAVVALQALKKAGVKSGHKVLVHGASGGVGSYAVQIAKAYGGHVTALCSSRHVDQAIELGADKVIDYTKSEIKGKISEYDVILGVNGYQSLKTYRQLLKEKGVYVMVGGYMKQIMAAEIFGKSYSKGSKQLMSLGSSKTNTTDIQQVMSWLEVGKITCPIEKTYSFTDATEAIKHMIKGHVKGKMVIDHQK